MHARGQVAKQLVGIRMESDALPIAGAKIFDDQQQRDRRRHQQHGLAGPLQRRDLPRLRQAAPFRPRHDAEHSGRGGPPHRHGHPRSLRSRLKLDILTWRMPSE